MSLGQPNPRFADYEQVLDQHGEPKGFMLPGCTFFFKYNQQGGWKDEKGNLYNSSAIQIEKEQDWDVDDDAIDEQEEELLKLQGGKVSQQQQDQKETQQLPEFKTIQEQIMYYVNTLKGKQNKLRIFIKNRSKVQMIKVNVTGNSRNQINLSISDQLSKVNEQERNKFVASLPKDSEIQFSFQNGNRYWFGHVNTTPEQFQNTYNLLSKNQYFGILKTKTLLHVSIHINFENSKEDIAKLQNQVNELNKQQQVVVSLANIGLQSPLSFVVDLIEQLNIPIQQIYEIQLDSKTSAKIWTNVKSALSLVKLQGLRQNESQLTVTVQTQKAPLIEPTVVNIILQKQKQQLALSEFLNKQLLILNSADDGYLRAIQGQIHVRYPVLKRLLMYRGSTLFNPITFKAYKL